jgi:hypothetical protein
MDSTVVAPKGMSSHPKPTGGTFGVLMSCDADRMRAVSSRERTRFPAGDTPPARWVRPNARRSRTVPIGVLPAEAQESGSMNMSVRRTPSDAGSGKCPTAVLRRMASSADVHESAMPTGAYTSRSRRSW